MEFHWTIQIVASKVRHRRVIIDAIGISPTAVHQQPRKHLIFEPEGLPVDNSEALNQNLSLALGRLFEIEEGIIANMRLHIRVFCAEDARMMLNSAVLKKLSSLGGELDVLFMTL